MAKDDKKKKDPMVYASDGSATPMSLLVKKAMMAAGKNQLKAATKPVDGSKLKAKATTSAGSVLASRKYASGGRIKIAKGGSHRCKKK